MDIKEAKAELRKLIQAYLARDGCGYYCIPCAGWRPVLLVGKMGIGKAAAVKQVAAELELPLVTRTITHYTRQTAVGRAFMAERQYGKKSVQVLDYTMGEILAAVGDMMEMSGKKEGILFLDGLERMPEALEPAILQLFRQRILGKYRLPEGWILIGDCSETGGERLQRFQDAVCDRLCRMEIQPDLKAWREYALCESVHGSVLAFLELYRQWFCVYQEAENASVYATPRGWTDLSGALTIYEKKGFSIHSALVKQYITDSEAGGSFCAFYTRYRKLEAEWPIAPILRGEWTKELADRAGELKEEERMMLAVRLAVDIAKAGQRLNGREWALKRTEAEVDGMETAGIGAAGIETGRKAPVEELLRAGLCSLRGQLEEQALTGFVSLRQRQRLCAQVQYYQELLETASRTEPGADSLQQVRLHLKVLWEKQEKDRAADFAARQQAAEFALQAWGEGEEVEMVRQGWGEENKGEMEQRQQGEG